MRRQGDAWRTDVRWTSVRLKPYYNDFVVHENHAYGFDGSSLACIELDGGTRRWKGGRYGHGQVLLLADQELLLVVSESGELALVEASPHGFTERDPTLVSRMTAAIERRHDALADTAGLNEEVFDALVILAAGSLEPGAIGRGHETVTDLARAMHQGRTQRLRILGFDDESAERLSGLHTRNFM